MTIEISSDVAQLVHGIYAGGGYSNESEVIAAAVQLLHSREQLRKELATGLRELDRGERLKTEDVFPGLRERAHELNGPST